MLDADTGDERFDYLAHGAKISVAFETDASFAATLAVSEAALVESGQTEDLDGDVRLDVVGTYSQHNGELAFVPISAENEFVDSIFEATGWTIASDGSSLRYENVDGDVLVEAVLTRQ